jgi:hypothetical protein
VHLAAFLLEMELSMRMMRLLRMGLGAVTGFLIALLLGTLFLATPLAQNSSQIAIAINQLVTGVTPFTNLRLGASTYQNWGSGTGDTGYGFRDNGGVIQVKSSGGTWATVDPTGAGDLDASYWTRVAEGDLTNETALGALATGVLLNTTTTGVPTIYAGTTCTNQFVLSLDASAAATCATVDLLTDTTGTLTVARGGTGLTAGTSGGILAFTATGTLASSAALTANQLILGGGAGVAPAALGSLGTTTTVLHGNAAGAPTFGAVVLTTDVSGILPGANGGSGNGFFAVTGPTTSLKTFTFPDASATMLTSAATVTTAQGGTGIASYTIGDLLQASGATTLSALAATSTGNALISGGVGTVSAWGKIGLTTHITGTLGPTNGGTGFASYTVGDLLYANSTTSLAPLTAPAIGQVLISQGAATAPVWSATARVTNLNLGANLALSATAPTISSGFGTTPSVTSGTSAAFRVDVGTGGSATAGVIALPTAATGWNCFVENLTATAANAMDQRTVQTASTTATATIENQTVSTGAALAWSASDILAVSCVAY